MRKTRHIEQLRPLCDGKQTAQEIADPLDWPRSTVKNMARRHDLPMRSPGDRKADRCGASNPSFLSGHRICSAGYVYVTPPLGHPGAFVRPGRQHGTIRLHRLAMEQRLGRHLRRSEVVDHIDGLTLHNDPSNLRLFATNAEHIAATLAAPTHSEIGISRMRRGKHLRRDLPRIDTYDLRKKRGDVRLRQCLLAALRFDTSSRFLLGTRQWFQRNGIDPESRPSLEHAYQQLLHRYELDLMRSE